MRFFFRRIVRCVLVFAAVCSAWANSPTANSTRANTSKDSVLIIGMSPAAFVDGVETEVEVTVAYELLSQDEGLVEIAANTLRAQGASPFSSLRVPKGTGTVTIKGKLTPRYWTSTVPARMSAFLVVAGEALTQRKAVASDHKKVAVALRPNAPETYSTNPNPRHVFEDVVDVLDVASRAAQCDLVFLVLLALTHTRPSQADDIRIPQDRGQCPPSHGSFVESLNPPKQPHDHSPRKE